jgi:hypothetical protein
MSTPDLTAINPEEELDLSGFGLQPFTDDLLIEDAGIEETDAGRRWFIVMRPQNEHEAAEELMNGVVQDGGYLSHSERPELVKYGVNGLKAVFRAVFGQDNGAIADLKGRMVRAKISEDDNGFARARRYQKAQG